MLRRFIVSSFIVWANVVLLSQRKFDRALQLNLRALTIDPHNTTALRCLGICQTMMNNPNEAKQTYERCLRIDPAHVACLMNLADLLQQESQYDEAAATYRRALDLGLNRETRYSCLVNLGACLGKRSAWGEAEYAYREASKLRPKRGDAHLGLCMSVWNQAKINEAREVCQEGLRRVPGDLPLVCTLAGYNYDMGSYEEALVHAVRACRLKKGCADAHIIRSALLLKLGKNQEAATAAETAVKLDPGISVAHMNLAQAFKLLGRYREAIQAYEKAVELAPDAWMLHQNLALLNANEGDFDAADKACRRLAILNEPEAKRVLELIAIEKISKGRSS